MVDFTFSQEDEENLEQKELERLQAEMAKEDSTMSQVAKDFARWKHKTKMAVPRFVGDVFIDPAVEFVTGKEDYSQKAMQKLSEGMATLESIQLDDINVQDIITKKGEVQKYDTLAGAGLEIGTAFAGGAAVQGATKLPLLISAALTDTVLFGDEENISTAIQGIINESQDIIVPYRPGEAPEQDYMLKDFVDFLAADEDDSALIKRGKYAVETLVLGGTLDAIFNTPKVLKAAKEKFNRAPFALNDKQRTELATEYLRDAAKNVQYKGTEGAQPIFSETAKTSAQVAQQNSSKLNRFLRQIFTTRGYFTPAAQNAFESSQYAQRQIVAEGEHIVNRLQKSLRDLGDETQTKQASDIIQRILNKDIPYPPNSSLDEKITFLKDKYNLTDDIAKNFLEARNLIDELSSRLVNSNIPNNEFRETIIENSGQYLRRSYRLYEDSGYTPSADVKEKAIDFLTDKAMASDANLSFSDARQIAEGKVDSILNKGDNLSDTNEYYESLRKVNKQILKSREDIPEPIRELMGEIKEPSESILLTVAKMAKLVETNKFLTQLNTLGQNKYIFNQPVTVGDAKYLEPISGTNSILDGKYTTKEMLDAIKDREVNFVSGKNEGVVKLFRNFATVKGASQAAKTIYSHVTHMRNILGGMQFGVANGVNPFKDSMETMRTLRNQIAQGGDKALDAEYEKYLKLGIINTNVRVNEFRALLETGYESEASNFLQNISKNLEGYGIPAEKLTGVPGDIYMAVDDFYKINNFNRELETLRKAFPDEPLNVLEEEAANIVRNTFPNYDRVPKGIKATRYLPIGNFVAFPSEIMRTSVNIVKQGAREIQSGNPTLVQRGLQRLSGFTTAMVGAGYLADQTASMAGLTEEENEAVQLLSQTPWSKSPRNIVMRDGVIYTNDTQFIDSYSPIKTPIINAIDAVQKGELRGDDLDKQLGDAIFEATKAFIAPYTDESMVTEALTDIYTAYTSADGRTTEGKLIFNPNQSKTDQAIEMFGVLVNTFVPGTITSLQSLADAATEKPNKTTGRPKSLEAELITNITGVRFTEFNPQDALMYAVKEYGFEKRNIPYVKADFQKESSGILEEYVRRQKNNYALQQNLYEKVRAASVLMDDVEVVRILVENGITEENAGLLLMGKFAAEEPPEKTVIEAVIKEMPSGATALELSQKMAEMYSRFAATSLIKVEETEDEEDLFFRPQPDFGELIEEAERTKFAKGGEVLVPNAPVEPDERIDKMTGRPYNEQAGKAFMDEEDPMRRLMFAEGGIAKLFGFDEESIKWANSVGEKYGKAEGLDGKGDAARHLALGWLASQTDNPKLARFAINAREAFDPQGREMDKHNNNLGFRIEGNSRDEVEQQIAKLIDNKDAMYFTPSQSAMRRGY